MKIDKQLAYKIAGSGFKLYGASYNWDIIAVSDLEESFIVTNGLHRDEIYWDQIGNEFAVISRTMDLTNPITVQGKEVVPLQVLAEKTNFNTKGYKIDHKILSVEHDKCFYINKNNSFVLRKGRKNISIQRPDLLYSWLEKNHFCYFLPDEMIVKMDNVYNN